MEANGGQWRPIDANRRQSTSSYGFNAPLPGASSTTILLAVPYCTNHCSLLARVAITRVATSNNLLSSSRATPSSSRLHENREIPNAHAMDGG
jgi:hypothetical protein